MLRDLGCRCLLGNHDEVMLVPELARSYSEHELVLASVDATRAALSEAELSFIRTFTPTLALDGGVFLYHGTPRSNTEDLLATTPDALVDEMLQGIQARLLAGGHTHLQMLRQHRGRLIVNTGSLGQPFEAFASHGPPRILAQAEYAIVDVQARSTSVDLRRVELERQALAAEVDGWDNPLAPWLGASYAA